MIEVFTVFTYTVRLAEMLPKPIKDELFNYIYKEVRVPPFRTEEIGLKEKILCYWKFKRIRKILRIFR